MDSKRRYDAPSSDYEYRGGNAVLDRLSPEAREAIYPHVRVIDNDAPSLWALRGKRVDAIAFPIAAIFSIAVEMTDGQAYEVDVIGSSGCAGGQELVLGNEPAMRTIICEIGGRTAVVGAETFHALLRTTPSFQETIDRSLREQVYRSQQTTACNYVHMPAERVARWILVLADEMRQSRFAFREEFLAILASLDESEARRALHLLQGLGTIAYADDHVEIWHRDRLAEQSCSCYLNRER